MCDLNIIILLFYLLLFFHHHHLVPEMLLFPWCHTIISPFGLWDSH